MKIRSHCQPGEWRNEEGWLPLQKWPENSTVQWGDGLVLKKGGLEKAFNSDDPLKTTTEQVSYVTAFFEVFLDDPATFLRGEGTDREAAEIDAWEKYVKIINCQGHEFERRGYKNGLGFCKHCNLSQTVFEPSTNR